MTAEVQFDRDLQNWLAAEAASSAPASLSAAVVDNARARRQRPRWLVTVRGGDYAGSIWGLERPARRIAYVLAIALLLLTLLVAVVAVGALLTEKIKVGRNGVIAFAILDSPTHTEPRMQFSIHLVNSEGTEDHQVGFGSCPVFSRDGTLMAFTSGLHSSSEVDVARADGSAPHAVADIGDSEFALSPDGSQIAWLKTLSPITSPDGLTTLGLKNELWVKSLADGGPGQRIVRASDVPNGWFSSLAWSPDGRGIAFAGFVSYFGIGLEGGYRTAIYVVDEDGSNLRKITARPAVDQTKISWSPDSRYITYDALPDATPAPPLGAPDRSIAALEVFVIQVDGSGDRNLTGAQGGGFEPDWSPDGTHIAYLTVREDREYLATVQMQGLAALGPPLIGPEADAYSWSPDGTTLLATHNAVSDSSVVPQSVVATIQSVDAEFRELPKTILATDLQLSCKPSWQRLER